MAGPKTGRNMYLYRNSGTVASPTWVLIDEIEDVSIPDFSMGIAELKRRATKWTKGIPTLIGLVTVDFKMWYGLDDTNESALRTAMLAGTAIEFAVMDGPIATAGSQGWRLPGIVTDYPWDQPLEDAASHDMKVTLAYMVEASSEIDPSWYTVSS